MDPKADFQHLSPPREGDQDRRWVLLAVVGSATLLSTATVILRIYARIKVTRNVGWDDRTIVMAQVLVSSLRTRSQSLKPFAGHKPPWYGFQYRNGYPWSRSAHVLLIHEANCQRRSLSPCCANIIHLSYRTGQMLGVLIPPTHHVKRDQSTAPLVPLRVDGRYDHSLNYYHHCDPISVYASRC